MKSNKEIKDKIVKNLSAMPYFRNTSWDVYKLKPSRMFKHHSLFFTPSSSPGDGFTVEIRVVNGKVVFWSMTFQNVPVSKFKCLGSINQSIENIIDFRLHRVVWYI